MQHKVSTGNVQVLRVPAMFLFACVDVCVAFCNSVCFQLSVLRLCVFFVVDCY